MSEDEKGLALWGGVDLDLTPSGIKRKSCAVCGKPLDPRWKICPYCEAEVGQPAEGRRTRPRRTAAAGGTPPRPAAARSSAQGRSGLPPEPTADRPARAGRDRPQSAG